MYVAYLRKSRKDLDAEARGEGETLARHRATLEKLAVKNGHKIEKWFAEVVSGESISARPEVQAMLSLVRGGAVDGVYVVEVERLARGDTSDQGQIAKTLKLTNTKIITPVKTYDPADEYDEEYFEFSLFMSRREYKTINRRIQAGRMASVREGKYICSRPPYGYRKVKIKNDKGYTLAVDEQEAQVVKQIFEWYINGDENGRHMGLTRIANRLLDMHVPTGAEGSTWKPCRIYRMLTNEVYIGKIRWGYVRAEQTLTEDGIEKTREMRKDYDLYDGLHPAIITDDVFYAVRNKLPHDGTPLQANKQLTNPLAGLVRCTECGHTLRGKPAAGRQPEMLFCATHGCRTVRTYRAAVESAILDTLAEWLNQYEVNLSHQPHTAVDHTADMVKTSLDALHAEEAALQTQKSRLHDLLERGIYDEQTYSERFTDISTRLRDVQKAVSELLAKQASEKPLYASISNLAPDIRHVLDFYDSVQTAQEKNTLLKRVISRVDYVKEVKGNQHIAGDQFKLTLYPRLL